MGRGGMTRGQAYILMALEGIRTAVLQEPEQRRTDLEILKEAGDDFFGN